MINKYIHKNFKYIEVKTLKNITGYNQINKQFLNRFNLWNEIQLQNY